MWEARLTDGSKHDVQPHAIIAIGQVAEKGDPESIKLLQASLCNENLTVSQSAALTLGDAQVIVLLQAQLTGDSKHDARKGCNCHRAGGRER